MYKILLANKGDFECFKDKTGKATSWRIAEVERIEVTQLSLPQKAMNMAKKTVAPLSNINVTCQRKKMIIQTFPNNDIHRIVAVH